MRSIGFDSGSGTTKAILLDAGGGIETMLYRRKAQDDVAATDAFLREIGRQHPDERFHLGAVGLDGLPDGVLGVNAIVAIARGVHAMHPAARSIIEVGGHTSKFIVVDEAGEVRDFATNEACAAGTGSFLEQQARRLDLDVEQLAALSLEAKSGATIAGRCSVFAKSDMIHLQQKGTPVAEIAYGLCLAICRNALATLLKGRDVEGPLVIAGGCAKNAGILRAFAEVLGGANLLASAHPGMEAALGAAAAAQQENARSFSLEEIRAHCSALLSAPSSRPEGLPPLVRTSTASRAVEPDDTREEPLEAWLGADIGSVSTDLVLIDDSGAVQSAVYLPTRGRPVEVLLEGLAIIRSRFPNGLHILGCATTGSGRHLGARLLGADVIKNEITCQTLGAQFFVPDVDTILEIGGQDSKFVSLRNGAIADFAMNKICAAGTGSFLEEQAREMGIAIERDFAARAFAATAPLDLGTRCTVFMETEVVNALRDGYSVEDICAGLARAIVKNYLDRIVGSRPLGKTIVFQGGVASNDAVVAAFESILGQPIHVHPYNRISGAIGAALAARSAVTGRGHSSFRSLSPTVRPSLRSFECRLCSNRCDVNVLDVEGRKAFFGDTCERYTSRGGGGLAPGTVLPANLAEEVVARAEAAFQDAGGRGLTIGIPRASSLYGSLTFWAVFFKALGHRPVLSPPSSEQTLAQGLKHLAVGVCLPIKLTAGHAHSLIGLGADFVFVPSIVLLPGDDPARSYACPYTMAVPFIVSTKSETRFLSPMISMQDEDEFLDGFAPYRDLLDANRTKMRAAWHEAIEAQEDVDDTFRRRAADLLQSRAYRHAFAVLGKPYNTLDPFMNLNLFERLRRLGVLAIPQTCLPIDTTGLSSELPWRFSADIQIATAALARMPDVHPVIVSNFGCGPDAFTFRQLGEILDGRPHLFLEFDEHRGEAGLITRLEAFLDQLETKDGRRSTAAVLRQDDTPPMPPPGSVVRIPWFADHAHAFAGLLRFQGLEARVLPPPTAAIRMLGEKHSAGRECHAYSMIAGDLLELSRNANGSELVFFFPGTSIPCLLHEYGRSMRTLLRELGVENVRVCAPTAADLANACNIDALERFYLGLLSIELLAKAVCQIRPYERIKGSTDAMLRRNLTAIEDAVAGGDVLATLDEALGRLSTIPRDDERNRPLVGLAGDIYTKTNASANNDLVRWLEDRGMEVWPSPFQIDMVDFGISRALSRSVAKLDLTGLLLHGPVAARREIDLWRVRNVVGGRIAHEEEPGYLEMKKLAMDYMPNEAHELLFINVAKIVDFARSGVDGIINAICFNCMMGNASAAVIEKIRRDHDDIPIITTVYSGGDDPSRRMVLEAFVSQATARHRRRIARAATTAAESRWSFSRPWA